MIIKTQLSHLSHSDAAVSCVELGKNYYPSGKKTVRGLSDCEMTILNGQFWGILGLNGSGKTTLLNLITGTLEPTVGTVKIFGFDINKHRILTAPHLFYVHQNHVINIRSCIYDEMMTVTMLYGLSQLDARSKLSHFMDMFEISKYKESRFSSLSGGTKRKVMLALAFAIDPQILVLDEPFNGLDYLSKVKAVEHIVSLKNKGKTIVATTHIVEEDLSRQFTHLAILDNGNIVRQDLIGSFINELEEDSYRITLKPDTYHHIKRDMVGKNIEFFKNNNDIVRLTVSSSEDLLEQMNHLKSLGFDIQSIEPTSNKMEQVIKHYTKNENNISPQQK